MQQLKIYVIICNESKNIVNNYYSDKRRRENGENDKKSIGFTQNDEALVEKITIYQKKNSLSFIAAVRELCETALKMETIVKKLG